MILFFSEIILYVSYDFLIPASPSFLSTSKMKVCMFESTKLTGLLVPRSFSTAYLSLSILVLT